MKIIRLPILYKTRRSNEFELANEKDTVPIELFRIKHIPINIDSIVYIEPCFDSDFNQRFTVAEVRY